jgi:hypothetical protein
MEEIGPAAVARWRVVAVMGVIAVVPPLLGIALADAEPRPSFLLLIDSVVIAVVAAALALRRPSRLETGWFVTLHQIPLTKRNGPIVVDYLARTRRWRVYGVVGSVSVAGGVEYASSSTDLNTFAVLFAGWFVGGVVAEVPLGARHVDGVRVASLERRTLSMYLSPGIARWIVCWALGTLGLLVVYGLVASAPGTRVASGVAVLAVLMLLSVSSMRAIVRRPQPAASSDVVAADDATRRAAVRRIAAGWGVLQCMVTIVVARWLTIGAGGDFTAQLAKAAQAVGVVGVIASWLVVPTRLSPPRPRLDRLVAP